MHQKHNSVRGVRGTGENTLEGQSGSMGFKACAGSYYRRCGFSKSTASLLLKPGKRSRQKQQALPSIISFGQVPFLCVQRQLARLDEANASSKRNPSGKKTAEKD
ncbi:hypothetical protein [Succinimonas sp.]|uniref:hypothetical protein n=1 Tax=Succinimonas sp. TaxID=1936151 RepID=UPI003863D8D2